MNILKFLNFLPHHLQSEIILNVDPKYIDKIRKFTKIDSQSDEIYQNKWYQEPEFRFENEYLWKSLIRALEFEYYELFEPLLKKYQQIYPLTKSRINHLLGAAAYIGNLDYVNRFISLGADDYQNAMNEAARGGYPAALKIIKLMESKGATNYQKALKSGAKGGKYQMVKNLLNLMEERKIQINYNEVLKNAAYSGDIKTFEMLRDLMEQRDIKIDYFDVLLEAVKEEHIEIVQWWLNDLKQGLTRRTLMDDKIPLIYAASGKNIEIFQIMFDLLESFSKSYDLTNVYNETLQSAAAGGNIEIFKMIFDSMNSAGREINYYNLWDNAPRSGNIEMIQMIFDLMNSAGIDIKYKTTFLKNAVMNAVMNEDLTVEIFEKILDIIDIKGKIPNNEILALAAKSGNYDIVKLMLEKGADDYQEAAIDAARGGSLEMTKLFLDLMNEKNIIPNYNQILEAVYNDDGKDIVEMIFLEKGKIMNYEKVLLNFLRYKRGWNIAKMILEKIYEEGITLDYNYILKVAVEYRNNDMVRMILEKMDQEGITPDYNQILRFAVKYLNYDIAKMMLEKGADNYKEELFTSVKEGNGLTNFEIFELLFNWISDSKTQLTYSELMKLLQMTKIQFDISRVIKMKMEE